MDALDSFAPFEAVLREPGPWIGGFDFPFGLPRELVMHLDWPQNWRDSMQRLRSHSRAELREMFRAFCNGRAVGNKFAHRKTDLSARSSSSMKWVNPPVAWMMLEGAPRLLDANVTLPGMHAGDPNRVALEAYPALVARMAIGNASYKSDTKKKQNDERRLHRETIVDFVTRKNALGVTVKIPARLARDLVDDGSGDWLDAVLCAFQAAVASMRENFSLPESFDALEGWIILA